MDLPEISAVIPAHNPDSGRLRRVLAGLAAQTLPLARWELVVVDNASSTDIAGILAAAGSVRARLVSEPRLGLTHARIAGVRSARGAVVVFVDDDNVLAPDYLSEVLKLFSARPRLGAAGGKAHPDFELPAEPWHREFLGLLALRDLGDAEKIAPGFRAGDAGPREYPHCAPIGAGMAVRREAALHWAGEVEGDARRQRLDRSGAALVSGGDNDLVMTVLEQGWDVGYFPSLSLTHIIPAPRLSAGYLSKLNRAIQRSWVQVLALHGANPWPRIPRYTVPLRQLRAFAGQRAWRSPAHRIRWLGLCGHYEGRAAI